MLGATASVHPAPTPQSTLSHPSTSAHVAAASVIKIVEAIANNRLGVDGLAESSTAPDMAWQHPDDQQGAAFTTEHFLTPLPAPDLLRPPRHRRS
eukprot:COSAG06_NODE_30225_length_542_cov_1.514673_1_plen_94_part_10